MKSAVNVQVRGRIGLTTECSPRRVTDRGAGRFLTGGTDDARAYGMSWQAVEWVMKHSTTTGTDRLVMLAIAEQCRGELPTNGGWEAYPGLSRIAHYAGFQNVRTAQTSITRMVESGLLEKDNGPQSIRADRRPNTYRILELRGVHCGFDDCGWCLAYGMRPDAPRKAPRGALRRQTGCATTTDGVRGDAPRHAPPHTRTVVNPSSPVEPSPLELENQKAKRREYLSTRLADIIAVYGHLGYDAVAARLEMAGYLHSDIEIVAELMEQTRRSA